MTAGEAEREISFGPGHAAARWGGAVAFEMVSRAREVYSRIREAQSGA